MAATVEVKYFNSFLLKKTAPQNASDTTPPVWNGSTGVPTGIAGAYPQVSNAVQADSWAIEEARIRGGYNNVIVDLGVKAYLVETEPNASFRTNSMIYSGVFNSRTGVNDTNVFSVGEDITRSVDPANGSIQKLYAEDTNLIIFQDKNRNAVMRLSQDGLTEISNYGMIDYFRDEFKNLDTVAVNGKAIGAWDIYTKQYVLSLQGSNIVNTYQTLAFDESVRGWTSFYTYKPEQIFSIQSNYFSVKDGQLWRHNNETGQNNDRSIFYGVYSDSSITFVFNPQVSLSKVFKTVNYEGSTGWEVSSFNAARSFDLNDTSNLVYSYDEGAYTQNGIQYYAGFYKKEGKYFANLINNSQATPGEIVFGNDITGVKGYYATVTIKTDDSTRVSGLGGKTRELFAVSSQYIESSY